jgi:release factor glutamine methyltransferase
MSTVQGLIAAGSAILAVRSDTARLDTELLLGHVLGRSRTAIVTAPKERVGSNAVQMFYSLVERRQSGMPIAYILGSKEFWGLDFKVTRDVLIPRPETEHLVEQALKIAEDMQDPIRILDLGTGTGCIAIALAYELFGRDQTFSIVAVDSSRAALTVAKENAIRHGVSKQIDFICSDWSSAISETFDLVVCNPPYVDDQERGKVKELDFEPSSALYAGKRGLSVIAQLLQDVALKLTTKGSLLLEIGAEQGQAMQEIFTRCAPSLKIVEIVKDLAGRDRVVIARKA